MSKSRVIDMTRKIAEKIQEEAGKLMSNSLYQPGGFTRNRAGRKYREAIFRDIADRHNI